MSSGPFESREQYELYKLAQRHRAAREAIQPLIRAKAAAAGFFMPRMLVYPDGRVTTEYTPEQQEILARYDENINYTFQRYLKA